MSERRSDNGKMKRTPILEVLVKGKNVIQKVGQRDERGYDLPGLGSSAWLPYFSSNTDTSKGRSRSCLHSHWRLCRGYGVDLTNFQYHTIYVCQVSSYTRSFLALSKASPLPRLTRFWLFIVSPKFLSLIFTYTQILHRFSIAH